MDTVHALQREIPARSMTAADLLRLGVACPNGLVGPTEHFNLAGAGKAPEIERCLGCRMPPIERAPFAVATSDVSHVVQ